ncbi:hypothetical protein KHA93_19600 [Bacillus sp. FJAT-49732]|uniref:Uncharacterized protein n=1 Tax=Lederbergia citrisecunda TaxID=2833583 RepID=A0A942YLT5_9BACI|nr:hypothetical protein [Lederbergia citrisecunda]MBS4201813.1 hypothetical protein [Lederbergia citrisecunda]
MPAGKLGRVASKIEIPASKPSRAARKVEIPSNQHAMSGIGSSFYLFLFLGFLYMAITLEPSNPENDTFMAFIGLVLAMFVSVVAMIVCFILTGLINLQKRAM